MKHNNIYKK